MRLGRWLDIALLAGPMVQAAGKRRALPVALRAVVLTQLLVVLGLAWLGVAFTAFYLAMEALALTPLQSLLALLGVLSVTILTLALLLRQTAKKPGLTDGLPTAREVSELAQGFVEGLGARDT